jgi:BCD family chlorophyll transporter-like MFS transporter
MSRNQFTAMVGQLSDRWLPFADAASQELSLSRLFRLSLFQVSVGMSLVLLSGTLNRIMVVELGRAAWLVSLMLAIPLLLAPARALIGFRSDFHRSFLGWRRVPYLWIGTLLQFGGLAIMPFALIVMTEPHSGPEWIGTAASMLAFVLVGLGVHTSQTAGLALATDLASDKTRPSVVAILYLMLLVGMIVAALGFAALLSDFGYVRLIRVIQGAAVITLVLNLVAMWKQEQRRPELTRHDRERPPFWDAWHSLTRNSSLSRLLIAIALGTAGFAMQDVLLEPYGAQVLGLSVSDTTLLTALMSAGMVVALIIASRLLAEDADPIRLAAHGALLGVFAFAGVVLSGPLDSTILFQIGTILIGLGNGLFAVGGLTAAMVMGSADSAGLTLGAWGAVQATATGLAVFAGGAIRDLVTSVVAGSAMDQSLGSTLAGYASVYHLEILILFVAMVALGPLVGLCSSRNDSQTGLQLADFPS